MYQFTREFIINNNEGKLTGGVKFKIGGADKKEVLYVDNLVNIRKQDVHAIYKTVGKAAHKESATLDLTGVSVAAGDILRVILKVGLEEMVSAVVNDAYLDHTKEYFFEAKAESANDLAGIIKSLSDQVTKNLNMNPQELVKVKSAASPKLVLEGSNVYVRFKTNEEKYNVHTEVTLIKADNTSDVDLSDKFTIATAADHGTVGRGTTAYLINNVRLQTVANLDPYGIDIDERPLPGSIYDQYTVELITERRHVGSQVMGAIDESLTTLVFFVLQGTVSNAFATELAKLCDITTGEIDDIDASSDDSVVPGQNLSLPVTRRTRKGSTSAVTIEDTSVLSEGLEISFA